MRQVEVAVAPGLVPVIAARGAGAGVARGAMPVKHVLAHRVVRRQVEAAAEPPHGRAVCRLRDEVTEVQVRRRHVRVVRVQHERDAHRRERRSRERRPVVRGRSGQARGRDFGIVDAALLDERAVLQHARFAAAAARALPAVAAEGCHAVGALDRVDEALLQAGEPLAHGDAISHGSRSRGRILGGRLLCRGLVLLFRLPGFRRLCRLCRLRRLRGRRRTGSCGGFLARPRRLGRRRALGRSRGGRRGFRAPAEAAPALGGRGDQRLTLFEGQRCRVAVLRDLRVLLPVSDIGAVAAFQHLEAGLREVQDRALAVGSDLRLHDLDRAREVERERVVLLDGGVLGAVLDVRAVLATADADRRAVLRMAEVARQRKQLQRIGERDVVHVLAGQETREARLLGIVARPLLHERAVRAHAHADRLAADRVLADFARLGDFLARHVLRDVVDFLDERLPETPELDVPFLLAVADLVEDVLHLRGEAVLDVVAEVLDQELADDLADVGGYEGAPAHLDVLAVAQCLDDGGVRRRPADAVALEGLHEARLGVARRRLREVLLRADRLERHALALGQRRKRLLVLALDVGLVLVVVLVIGGEEARLEQGLAVRAQHVPVRAGRGLQAAGDEVDGHRVEHRGRHLAGDRALPHQRIQAALILVVDVALGFLRGLGGDGRPDRLVRLLRVLRLRLVLVDAVGKRLPAELRLDGLPDLAHRLGRQVDRVRAHVGDVAGLVEPLRRLHRAPRGEAELARRLLLHRGRRERRRRVPALGPALDACDREHAVCNREDRALDVARVAFVGDGEARLLRVRLDFFPAELGEPRGEARRFLRRIGLDGPVLLALELLDLGLALADEPERDALHAAGGKAGLDLLPQQRREVEPDQVVERPPRLVGIDEVAVHALLGLRDRLANRVLRDLVETDPVDVLAVERAALLEDLVQVPGDRLALAVRVRCEIEGVRLLHGALDRVHLGAVLLDGLVLHLEVVVGVDRAFLLDEVADVAIGGQHLEIGPEVLLDGFRLGRRLDDDEICAHVWRFNARPPETLKPRARPRLLVAPGAQAFSAWHPGARRRPGLPSAGRRFPAPAG